MKLDEIAKEARTSVQLSHSPQFVMQYLRPITLPIPKEEADALFHRMSKRFREWTGQDITRYKP